MATAHSIVIGGTKGLGRALARRWVAAGHRVSVIGRSPAKERGVTGFAADLADGAQLEAALAAAIRRNGPVDRVAFCQRFRGEGDVWDGELAVSLTATRRAIEALAGKFRRKGGAIVIVGSLASTLVADEQPAGYHVAKAGLAQLVRYFAVVLGPKGIRVNGVSSAAFVKDESKAYYAAQKDLLAAYAKITPLGRLARAEELVDAVDFLASPAAAFVTGQELVVDGGLSLQLQGSLIRKLAPTKGE